MTYSMTPEEDEQLSSMPPAANMSIQAAPPPQPESIFTQPEPEPEPEPLSYAAIVNIKVRYRTERQTRELIAGLPDADPPASKLCENASVANQEAVITLFNENEVAWRMTAPASRMIQ